VHCVSSGVSYSGCVGGSGDGASIAVVAPQGVWVGLYKISDGRNTLARRAVIDDSVWYFVSVEPGAYEIAVVVGGTTVCIPTVIPKVAYASQRSVSLNLAGIAELFQSGHECTDALTNHS
jgi:hypothetical protein